MGKIFIYIKRNFSIQFNAFIATTSIPGYKFTNCSEDKSIQFCWHSVLWICLYTVILISFGFWIQYQNAATLTVMEVLELGTELPYPSVYLCLIHPLNPEKIKMHKQDILLNANDSMPINELINNLQSALRFQRSTRNTTYSLKNVDLNKMYHTLSKLFYHVDEVITDCQFKGIHYPCKELLTPLFMAPGLCFVFNSIYTQRNFTENPHNRTYHKFSELDDDWSFRFAIPNFNNALFIFLKDPRDILALTDFPMFVWKPSKTSARYSFTVDNHYAEKPVRDLSESQRKCRYEDETFPYEQLRKQFKNNFYYKGLCLNYCHALEFQRYCHCLPGSIVYFHRNITANLCSFHDIECFEAKYRSVRKTHCYNCLDNCNYNEYTSRPEIKIRAISPTLNNKSFGVASSKNESFNITLDLEYWPELKYRTLVIFTTTEFLIALVGMAGLFLGTSFFTAFEAFYGFFIRYPCSYYVNWDYLKAEFEKLEEEERSRQLPCIDMSLRCSIKK